MHQARPAKSAPFLWALALILVAALLAYGATLSYSFYWEDPFDFRLADSFTLDTLNRPAGYVFYRPLHYLLLQSLDPAAGGRSPLPYAIFTLAGHALSALLIALWSRALFGDEGRAALAGLVLALTPLAHEALRVASPHSWMLAGLLGGALIYTRARQRRQPWLLGPVLLIQAALLGWHENGVLLPGLLILSEAALLAQDRQQRIGWEALAFALPSLLYLAFWISLPRSNAPEDTGLHAAKLAYLSQSLSYPVAAPLTWLRLPLDGTWLAGLAGLISLGLLAALHSRREWFRLAWGLALWLGLLLPAWYGLSLAYLEVSPRVLYVGAAGAAFLWAGLLPPEGQPLRSLRGGLGLGCAALLIAGSGGLIARQAALYRQGSALMQAAIEEARSAGEGARLLYVNFPDRLTYDQQTLPMGYWGMLLAPASQELHEFVALSSGVQVDSRSLAAWALLGPADAASPLAISPRGGFETDSAALTESMRWADAVLLVQMDEEGVLRLSAVGSIEPGQALTEPLARFENTAALLQLTPSYEPGQLQIALGWQSYGGARLRDTISVQVLDPAGTILAQSDGDSLGGLLPMVEWEAGITLNDRRVLSLPETLPPGCCTLRVLVYDWGSGERRGDPYDQALPLP